MDNGYCRGGGGREQRSGIVFAVSLLFGLVGVSPASATGTFTIGDNISFSDGTPAPGAKVDLFEAETRYRRGPFLTSRRADSAGQYGFEVGRGCYILVFIAPAGTSFRSAGAGQVYSQRHVCIEDASNYDMDEILYRSGDKPPPPPPPPPKPKPGIDIEKFVNGHDADVPPGPSIEAGGTASFTYVVRNTGNVSLERVAVTDNVAGAITCPRSTLEVGGSMDCSPTTMTAVVGQHTMEACVTGFNEGAEVSDCDPVYWTVPPPPPGDPMIDIEKFVNDLDADNPPGPSIETGETARFTYLVRNTGDVPLEQVSVVDNVAGTIVCPQSFLAVGGSMNCTPTSVEAEVGDHSMESCVSAVNDARRVTDCDPVYWTVPPPPSTKIKRCTHRYKVGMIVLARAKPDRGFMPPLSVVIDGEEVIDLAIYGRANDEPAWGPFDPDRWKIKNKDKGVKYVEITDRDGTYQVRCGIEGSPIGFDLDGSGQVDRIDGTFTFDIDNDGTSDQLGEWFAPTEGILIDTNVETDEPGLLTGAHLFGDLGGRYDDGYQNLARLDSNTDGELAGSELAGLALWVDTNSNAVLDSGEWSSLADHGIVRISTSHDNMVSVAFRADGTTIVTEDLWFPITATGGVNGTRIVFLATLGLGVVGAAVVAARRRREQLEAELAELAGSRT